MSDIYKNRISRILIEGGKKLTQNLLRMNLIDDFFWFKSNVTINQNGKINIRNLINKIENKKTKNDTTQPPKPQNDTLSKLLNTIQN